MVQLPLCIDSSFEAAERRTGSYLAETFDTLVWSDATPKSAIRSIIAR